MHPFQKAFIETQQQLAEVKQKATQTQVYLQQNEMEFRKGSLALKQLKEVPIEANTYRTVGRTFRKVKLADVHDVLDKQLKLCKNTMTKQEKELTFYKTKAGELQKKVMHMHQVIQNAQRAKK
mmetsp:Transcript_3097/g.3442  ORF Transcript_3097/g.3442 Transcript_3097/m.3442 type:complete len:123 (-) Transcript_3097:28-396(-)